MKFMSFLFLKLFSFSLFLMDVQLLQHLHWKDYPSWIVFKHLSKIIWKFLSHWIPLPLCRVLYQTGFALFHKTEDGTSALFLVHGQHQVEVLEYCLLRQVTDGQLLGKVCGLGVGFPLMLGRRMRGIGRKVFCH